MEEYDVLVIGAGPAGSRAAEASASGGARTLLVEKRKEVGVPVQCAEFLHTKVVEELKVPDGIVTQEVMGMVTHLPGDDDCRMRTPGCILDRGSFDRLLARRAVEAGAELRTGTRAEAALHNEAGGVVGAVLESARGAGRYEVGAKVVIGADGPRSTVGSWIGRVNEDILVANQVTVELKEPSDITEVFLHPSYHGGYGWLFPKGRLANVGVGVDTSLGGSPRTSLSDLLEVVDHRIGGTVRTTAGLIPVGGPLEPVEGTVLLVGDAAGFTHPISGGGIHEAVATGLFAGRAAASFVQGDDDALGTYQGDWEGLFGRSLRHAASRRREMVRSWNEAVNTMGSFVSLMHRCWIGYKEYSAE